MKTMRLEDIYQSISLELTQVEAIIKEDIKKMTAKYGQVESVVDYFFNIPGKKLRPALVLLSARAASPSIKPLDNKAITLAVAVELIHSASLVQDDIIDDAFFRRNGLTVDRKYSRSIAILLGDLLYARAISILAEEVDREILILFSKCVEGMCCGEIKALNSERVSGKEYLEIIEAKTASFMSACCRGGAILGGGNNGVISAMAEYGLNIGMCYQIIDDYIDDDSINHDYIELEKAEEYSRKAREAIMIIKDSVYKEKLFDLNSFIMNYASAEENKFADNM